MDGGVCQRKFFTAPRPKPRFRYKVGFEVSLFFEAYQAAVDFYSQVLAPPAYVQVEGANRW